MALSSVGTVYGSVQTRLGSGTCATCGSGAAKTAQAYGSYAGRGDAYTCATCGRTLQNSSSYCPTCSGAARTSGSTGSVYGQSATCPTCPKSKAATGNSYTSWQGTTSTASRSTNTAAGATYGKTATTTASWVR